MEQMGLRRDPMDEVFLTPLIARIREWLGEDVYAEAEGEGRPVSYDRVIAEVRE